MKNQLKNLEELIEEIREEFRKRFGRFYCDKEKQLVDTEGTLIVASDEIEDFIKEICYIVAKETAEAGRIKAKSENSCDYDFGGETPSDKMHNEMRGMDQIFGFNQAVNQQQNQLKEWLNVSNKPNEK